MTIRELAQRWQQEAEAPATTLPYRLALDLETAARLEALHELYPQRPCERLLAELLGAALEELEAGFPYVPGSRVIATDELGDPLYEDVGITPRYLELARKHLQRLQAQPATTRD